MKRIESAEELARLLREYDELDLLLEDDIYLEDGLILEFDNKTIRFNGDGVFKGDHFGRQVHEGEELTTWKSPTLTLIGNNNSISGLKVSNTAGDIKRKGQGVAFSLYGHDNVFSDFVFSSYQDTLYVGSLPDDLKIRYKDFLPKKIIEYKNQGANTFKNGMVLGSVDFIFGTGQQNFNSCDIIFVEDEATKLYAVAPGHTKKDDGAFIFTHCRFINKNTTKKDLYLARPWREHAAAYFIKCSYPNELKEEGFTPFENTDRHLSADFKEYPLAKTRVAWVSEWKE